MFKIERYSVVPERNDTLFCENMGYENIPMKSWLKKRISESRISKAFPEGGAVRWITVHPGGGKGIPVMIRQGKDGEYRVIGGAGGKLNMLKLKNIKSPEEYKKEAEDRANGQKNKTEEEKKADRETAKGYKQETAKRITELTGEKGSTGSVIKKAEAKVREFAEQVKQNTEVKQYVMDAVSGNEDTENVPPELSFNMEESDKNIKVLKEVLLLKNKLREIHGKQPITIKSLLKDRDLEKEKDTFLNTSLIKAVESLPDHEKMELEGSVDRFNAISSSFLGGVGIDHELVQRLGINQTGQLLAKLIKDNYGDDYESIKTASENKHGQGSAHRAKTAIEESNKLLEGIGEDVKITDLSTALDAYNLKDEESARVKEASNIVGKTLGELTAHASLNYGFSSFSDDIEIDSESKDYLDEKGLVNGIDYSQDVDKITIKGEGYKKLLSNIDSENVKTDLEIAMIKRGDRDVKGWLPEGVVSRDIKSFEDPKDMAKMPKESINEQRIGGKDAEEAVHRVLGEIPEAISAFKDELNNEDKMALKKYWEENIYKGSSAERENEKQYKQGDSITPQKAWNQFSGGDDESAYQKINKDIKDNSKEDMFGNTVYDPLYYVEPGAYETYRGIPGSDEIFNQIESLQSDIDKGLVHDDKKAREELNRLKNDMPEELDNLYKNSMEDYYHRNMSPYTDEQYKSSQERQEGSPWEEFTRMFGGDTEKALSSVKDAVKRDFNSKYLESYRAVSKKGLHETEKEISNKRDFLLGSLGKEERDRFTERAKKEMAKAGAFVANRDNGKFAKGSWRDKAIELMQSDSKQMDMFGEAELKQDDGTTYKSFGEKGDSDLKNIVNKLGEGRNPKDKYNVTPGMNMDGKYAVQQRAIRMFDKVKKMNLTFGTGQGKSITSIGAFTQLKGDGKVKRALFVTPSAVVKQFGGEVLKYTEPGKYKYSTGNDLDKEQRLNALRGSDDMVVLTHQSMRDDIVSLLGKGWGTTDEETKTRFNEMTPEDRNKEMAGMMSREGIDFGMFVIDEAHYDTDREGKHDSTMSNIFDSIRDNTDYYMRQSATPIKNDLSEVFSMLKKTDPKKFTMDWKEFQGKYEKNGVLQKDALQRLVHRYNYASPTETGTKRKMKRVEVKLNPEQKTRYSESMKLIDIARVKRNAGRTPIGEMKKLMPSEFEGLSDYETRKKAMKLSKNLGPIKRKIQNEIVNTSGGAKLDEIKKIVSSHVYEKDHKNGKAGTAQPGVVFAYNRESVRKIKEELEKQGLRVGVITGDDSSSEKANKREGFNPDDPNSRKYDVMVASDAGATGLNLQNAKYLVNYDLPDTAWVKKQREGRIDRHGQAHDEINYYDLVSDTDYDQKNWDRIQRKATLGEVFEQDPGELDDTGILNEIKIAS